MLRLSKPRSCGGNEPKVHPGGSRRISDEPRVLFREVQRETRRILARLDRRPPPLRLRGQWGGRQHPVGGLGGQAEPARERDRLTEHPERGKQGRVGHQLRRRASSQIADRQHGADRRQDRRDALDELGRPAREDHQRSGLGLGRAAQDGRINEPG